MTRLSTVCAFLFIATTAHAYGVGTGVVGNSGKTTGLVCNNCHVGPAAPTTIALKGPATLTAGMTAIYTLTVGIAGAPAATDAGMDIAASDPEAKLAPITAGVVAAGGELVHSAPLTIAGGGGGGGGKSVTVSFNVTAPPTNGTLTLYADGVIGDGLDAVASSRGATTKLDITVTGGVAPPPPSSQDMATGPGGSGDSPSHGDMAESGGGAPTLMSGDMATGHAATNPTMVGGCSVTDGGSSGGMAGLLALWLTLFGLSLHRRAARIRARRRP